MQLKYKHTQKAGMPFYGVLAVGIGALIMAFTTGGPPIGIIVLVVILLLWAVLLMSSLTVRIDDQSLRVRFGPGVFFKKFPISEIAGIGPKYTTYIWGWGIRWYFGGWLYNIAGFKSVEVIFRNGKKVRIGTDEPKQLAEVIRLVMRKTPKTAV